MDGTIQYDGRTIGYAIYGVPDGVPIAYIPGIPSSRFEARIFAHDGAKAAGVKLVSIERPGYGLSSYVEGRNMLDFAEDVAEVMASLGHPRYAVLGMSGGGPYAMACGIRPRSGITAIGLVSSLGPLDLPEFGDGKIPLSRVFRLFRLLGRYPWIARVVWTALSFFGRFKPDLALKMLTAQSPPLDRAVLSRDGIRQQIREFMFITPFVDGVRGAVWDGLLLGRPWGFRACDVTVPAFLWHGEADVQCPPAMGHFLAEHIPNCRMRWVAGAGHLLIADHAEEILCTLAATVP